MMNKSSVAIGCAASTSRKPEKAPWAHLNTNYTLGTDAVPKSTDYQNRFASTECNFRSAGMNSPDAERVKNKAKMTSDSV